MLGSDNVVHHLRDYRQNRVICCCCQRKFTLASLPVGAPPAKTTNVTKSSCCSATCQHISSSVASWKKRGKKTSKQRGPFLFYIMWRPACWHMATALAHLPLFCLARVSPCNNVWPEFMRNVECQTVERLAAESCNVSMGDKVDEVPWVGLAGPVLYRCCVFVNKCHLGFF